MPESSKASTGLTDRVISVTCERSSESKGASMVKPCERRPTKSGNASDRNHSWTLADRRLSTSPPVRPTGVGNTIVVAKILPQRVKFCQFWRRKGREEGVNYSCFDFRRIASSWHPANRWSRWEQRFLYALNSFFVTTIASILEPEVSYWRRGALSGKNMQEELR